MAPRIDFIGIVVADMAASLAFYRRLGLDIPSDVDGQGHVEAKLPGGLRMAWDSVAEMHKFDPEWRRGEGSSPVELAFVCDDPADVDAQHAALVAAGYRSHKEPWDAFWGQRYAIVLDPDGNAASLFAPLPQ